MRQIYLIGMILCCLAQAIAQQSNKEIVKIDMQEMQTIFKQGDHGYACYRIPAVVVANDGSILAFAEARKRSCSDTGDIDLVMRKSTDNGKTWSPLKVIFNDGKNVCGNPSPVVDEETGTIHLLTTWNNGDDHESEIISGTSIDGREVYHQFSNDHGETWSKPKNISKTTKKEDWTWYATGPVHGMQVEKGQYKGRLIIPCDHIERDSKKYYSHVIYSDDHGASWQLGGTTPKDQVNECTIAALDNGDLILNMRNYKREEQQARQVAISSDGGITWKNQHIDAELPEPRCQGAMINLDRNGKNIMLFTNPANPKKRINMTLAISRDNAESWNEKIVLFEGPSAYSDLVDLKNGKIMVLFEAGVDNPYEGIHYKLVDLP